MPIIAYKIFEKGLVCRGYQFKTDVVNKTDAANCRQNGFHCAEDPLDCLTYYPNFEDTECWEVVASGDIDEDDVDSKISCTEMRLVRQLDLEAFLEAALIYMARHPFRELNNKVQRGRGEAVNGFTIVRGVDPVAAGENGSFLALAKENAETRRIENIAIWAVDGKRFKSGVFYNVRGVEGAVQES